MPSEYAAGRGHVHPGHGRGRARRQAQGGLGIAARAGSARRQRPRRSAESTAHQGMQVVAVPLHYAKGGLLAQVAVDADGKIAGFLIQPAQPPAPAAAPAADASFIERDFVGGARPARHAGDAEGAGVGAFPAVVLVHGSGPHDRDETIGPNRPFLDIARGLAAQGIAVLRYEKRSKARPQDFADGTFGVDEETTNDAVAGRGRVARCAGHRPGARVRARPQPGRDDGAAHRARFRPRRRPGPAGRAGALAARHRDRAEPLPAGCERRYRCAGAKSWTNWTAGLPRYAATASLPTRTRRWACLPVTGAHSTRWTHLPKPARWDCRCWCCRARAISRWSTPTGSFGAGFAAGPRATFKHYPALNHLGIAGEGPGTLAEYNKPGGHVDAQLIDDVAAWIRLH